MFFLTNFSSDASRNHGSQSTRTLVFETVNIGQGDHRTQLSQVMLPVVAICFSSASAAA